jgi:excisionase family DNA binding protein
MNQIKPQSLFPLEKYPARMRPDQVAAYLNCSDDLVLSLIKNGHLPAVNVAAPGSTQPCYRIEKRALAEFEQSRKSS